MPLNGHTIIDGDGHVIEDAKAIINSCPSRTATSTRPIVFSIRFRRSIIFTPPTCMTFQPGAFNKVGPDGWVDFLEDVGIETTVLYTTLGLAFGKIVSRDWAIDVARGLQRLAL